MTLDFDEFASTYGSSADLGQTVSQVKETLKIDVYSKRLEDCAHLPLGPADPVLDLCGISPSLRAKIVPQPKENQRFDDAVLLALLDANRAYADRDERKAAKHLILAEASKNVRYSKVLRSQDHSPNRDTALFDGRR